MQKLFQFFSRQPLVKDFLASPEKRGWYLCEKGLAEIASPDKTCIIYRILFFLIQAFREKITVGSPLPTAARISSGDIPCTLPRRVKLQIFLS